jgi:hypothetical protein
VGTRGPQYSLEIKKLQKIVNSIDAVLLPDNINIRERMEHLFNAAVFHTCVELN